MDRIRPEWLDVILTILPPEERASINKIENKVVRGFWFLNLNGRTLIACFRDAEKLLNTELLDTSFGFREIEVGEQNFKEEVLEYMRGV
jgi:hypothetical protein